jgi:hypothetical protein
MILIRGREASVLLKSKPLRTGFETVSNDGVVLGNELARGSRGDYPVPFLLRNGTVELLAPEWLEAEIVGVAGCGFTSDGGILITVTKCLPGTGFYGSIEVLHPPRWQKIRDTGSGPNRVVAQTPLGYIGEITYFKGRMLAPDWNPVHMVGDLRAAYFNEDETNWLEVPSGMFHSRVTACSPDGEVVAGFGFAAVRTPIIWRNGRRVAPLSNMKTLGQTEFSSVSAHGELVVGRIGLSEPREAIVWREKENVQSLEDFLREQKVEVPNGWTLLDAHGVNEDGSTIVGSARNAEGKVRPFRVRIPTLESSR